MSGCARLYRLVTSTLADGTPAGTGRLSASTSSTMHMSVLNTSTLSPGALAPTSPSVEPKVSTTGAWKTSLIAARVSGSSVSPIAVTASGAMCRRPARCSAARRASIEEYPYTMGACNVFSRSTICGSGRGQCLLDEVAGEPLVGEHLLQRGHHVGLGHHGQARQVGRLEPVDVDPGQPTAVEGCVRDGVGEQPAEPVLLGSVDLLGAPCQPLQVVGVIDPPKVRSRQPRQSTAVGPACNQDGGSGASGNPKARYTSPIASSRPSAAGLASCSIVRPERTAKMNSAIDWGATAGCRPARSWSRPSTEASSSTARACASA